MAKQIERQARRRQRWVILRVTAITSLAMLLGSLLLLTLPALHSASHERMEAMAARLESRLSDLRTDAERLIRVGTDWLAASDLALDHRSLNRRFIPVLDRLGEIDSVRIADTDGNEWMLRPHGEGLWLNRLIGSVKNPDDTRRFLTWKGVDQLLEDARRPSSYQLAQQDWYRKASQAGPGTLIWTQVQRLPGSGVPGLMAAMRLPSTDERGLIIAVALRLSGLHQEITRLPIGETGQAALLSAQGQFLDFSSTTGLEHHTHYFTSPLALQTQPLRQAVDRWLERDAQGSAQQLLLHAGMPWYLGYRPLPLGTENLWLLAVLPVQEILPGVWVRIALLAGLFILVLLLAGAAAGRTVAPRTPELD